MANAKRMIEEKKSQLGITKVCLLKFLLQTVSIFKLGSYIVISVAIKLENYNINFSDGLSIFKLIYLI